MKYQIETKLDLGDLGEVDATVDGYVSDTGLFGEGTEYKETEIEKIVAHVPIRSGAIIPLNIAVEKLSKAAEVSICEELERMHEAERRGA